MNVGLDHLHREREPLCDVVKERDCGALVGLGLDAQHPQPGAVVDGSELVVPLDRDPRDRGDGASRALAAARRRDVARHLFGVAQHRHAMQDLALLLSIVHQDFLSRKTPTVNDLRQF